MATQIAPSYLLRPLHITMISYPYRPRLWKKTLKEEVDKEVLFLKY